MRKMSKSLGNGIDPMEVIEKYGADALRWFLSNGSAPGQDVRFSYDFKGHTIGEFCEYLTTEEDDMKPLPFIVCPVVTFPSLLVPSC